MRGHQAFTTISQIIRRYIISLVVLTLVMWAQVAGAATLAYWHFSETSGNTAADSSGNGYNGTLSGGIDTSSLGGNLGGSGWMSGGKLKISSSTSANNHVDTTMPLDLLEGANGFTAEAILTWTGASNENWSPIFGQTGNPHETHGILFFGKVDSGTSININIAGTSGGGIAGTNLFDGNEHHVALVFDNPNNQYRVYVDYNQVGSAINAGTGNPTFSSTNMLRIGGNGHSANERWIGNFNEARFSDVALDSSQFLTLSAPAPEPSSFALFAAAGLIVPRLLRKRAAR